MSQADRDICIRNHVMGVLVSYSGKGLSYSNMAELAEAITEAVMEGDRKWLEENCCEQILSMGEDIPQ